MKKELIQRMIIDYQNKKQQKLTERDLKIEFIPNMAIGIVGIRRGGKTFRTHQLASKLKKNITIKNICRIQFNDHRLQNIPSKELHIIDESFYTLYPEKRDTEDVLFIFDEIHRVKGWEDYILYLLESENHKVVITGSTATLQRGEFASSLRGKFFPIELYPFSFKEFTKHYNIKEDILSSKGRSFLQNNLEKYLTQGGFPGLLNIAKERHSDLLRNYWDTMLLRDIIEAHSDENINISLLRYFADSLITRVGCPMSVNKLAKTIKTAGFNFTQDTLYRYLLYLSDAYMIHTVDIFSESERVRARNYKKVYCIDWALANAISYGAGVDKTRALENMVYIELKRRGYKVNYYKTRDDFEIDFVVTNHNKEIGLIQVAYSLDNEDVKNREFRAIVKSTEFLKSNSSIVITINDDFIEEIEGVLIKVIPAWKWLLE